MSAKDCWSSQCQLLIVVRSHDRRRYMEKKEKCEAKIEVIHDERKLILCFRI